MTETARVADFSGATKNKITDEHIERARQLVGYDEVSSKRDASTIASHDNIRAFAISIGCDNPLHCDPEYARQTRWGDVVAPGNIMLNAALRGDPRPEAIARAKKGLFRGIHQVHSGSSWQWFRPIHPGDILHSYAGEESVEVKQSEFGGRTVLRTSREVKFNQNADVVAVRRLLIVHSERGTAAKRGKYMAIEPAFYSDDDLAAIDAIYAAEQVRGAELRYWEDVAVGDSLGVMAKGPLTVTDIICLHSTGFAQTEIGPSTGRLRYKARQRMPAAFVKDKRGIPDIVMRMHWDDDWARALGAPMAYDYGYQRECWLTHYLTDWCGDDGILLQANCNIRKFNFLGDFQTITGELTGKRLEDGRPVVDTQVRFVSQRGETTMEAGATIALPSRQHGPAQYPAPPGEFVERARAFLDRHMELK